MDVSPVSGVDKSGKTHHCISLLDRAEQYYLSKEMLMEQKLRGADRGQPRGGKGEQKVLKGRGNKGDREKGSLQGKGKDKADVTTKYRWHP